MLIPSNPSQNHTSCLWIYLPFGSSCVININININIIVIVISRSTESWIVDLNLGSWSWWWIQDGELWSWIMIPTRLLRYTLCLTHMRQIVICKYGTTEVRKEKWRCELAFLCDITRHLNVLNRRPQEFKFELLNNLFAVDVERAPVDIQMELTNIHCNDTLKAKYDCGRYTVSNLIPEMMPQLRLNAAQILCMFGSKYLCEQLFCVMKMNKNPHKSCLTDAHLHSILRVSTEQNLTQNINELAAKKRCQTSGSGT